MAITIDDISSALKELEIHHTDYSSESEHDVEIRTWLPLRTYNFMDRNGLNMSIITYEEGGYLRTIIWDICHTENKDRRADILSFVNRKNWAVKGVKFWHYGSKMDGADGEEVDILCVGCSTEVFIQDGTLTTDQLSRCIFAMLAIIDDTWVELMGVMDIAPPADTTQETMDWNPDELGPEDKQKLIDLFKGYLDEQFENA